MRIARPGQCLASLDVLILAGGLGTRLRPAVGETPKVLAPVAGRPYLAYLLEWLTHFGARQVLLGLGYKAQAVIDYLETSPTPGLDIATIIEPEPLGTAGAIRFARPRLRSDPVLVMNGDSFADGDLCALLAMQRQSGALGTMLCAEVAAAGRYGRVAIDPSSRIIGYFEKDPACEGVAPINAGVYFLSAALLDDIAAGSARSLEREVFQMLPPGSLAAMVGCNRFVDIGTPESLARAADVLSPSVAKS